MTSVQRSLFVGCVVISWCGSAVAQDGDPPPPTRAHPIELRIQTASNVASGGALFGLALAPGLTYETEGENLILNLSAGAGFFVSPNLAVGGDVGITIFNANDETLKLISFVPYLKYVTGMPERSSGFFIEPSFGFTIVDLGDSFDSETLMQLSVWAGGHFFIGRSSTAFLVGPYVTYLRAISSDAEDADDILIGVKFGVSTYLL